MERIFALIASFNSDLSLLEKVLEAARKKVNGVIITDNHSKPEAQDALRALAANYTGFVTILWKPEDLGLAASLNDGAKEAIKQGATWILTLDDDSLPGTDMIEKMLSAYHALPEEKQNLIGLITPNEKTPRGFGYPNNPPEINENGGTTAGQMVKASILPKVGFWNAGFFIDAVDGEFCFRVRQKGWKTLLVPQAVIYTRPGDPLLRKFLGRTISVPNYRPYRYYYMCRNFSYMYLRNFSTYIFHNNYWREAIMTILFPRFLIKMILFEKNRGEKLQAARRGIWDGIRGRLGPMPKTN